MSLTRAASHCAGLLLRLAWFAAIVGANLHAEEAPSITSAQGNAPGWITIGYEHSGSDGVLGFALEADKRGIVQTQGAPVGQFFDTSLSPNSKHSYRVCAIYEESQLECSAWVQAQTLPAPAAAIELQSTDHFELSRDADLHRDRLGSHWDLLENHGRVEQGRVRPRSALR